MKRWFISFLVLTVMSFHPANSDEAMDDPVRDLYDAGKVQEARELLVSTVNKYREDIKKYKSLSNVKDAEYYRILTYEVAQQIVDALKHEVKIAKDNPTPDEVLSLSLLPFLIINETEHIIKVSSLNLSKRHLATQQCLSDALYVAVELNLTLNRTQDANKILEDHKDFIDDDPIDGPRFYSLLKLNMPKVLIDKQKKRFGDNAGTPATAVNNTTTVSSTSQAVTVKGSDLSIIFTIEKYYEALSTKDRNLLAQVLPDDEEGYYSVDEYLKLLQSELAKFSPNNPVFHAQLSEKSNITIQYNQEKQEYFVSIMGVTKTIQADDKNLKQSEADEFTLRKDISGHFKIYIRKKR